MNISEEIEKLQALHESGVLTDEEFARAKSTVISSTPETNYGGAAARDSNLEKIKLQNDVAQLDREWQLMREKYVVTGKYGSRSLPNAVGSILGAVLAGGFGICWTIGATSAGAPAFFTMFGVIFVLLAIGGGIYSFVKAEEYRQAEQNYQQRGALLLSKIDHGDR